MIDLEKMLSIAKDARESAYAPYSKFKVGAALLCDDGKIYTGCNIENASFSPTCCAERVAIFKAVSEGKQNFSAIAIVGGSADTDSACYPCGVCRQVFGEFCSDDFIIITENSNKIETLTLGKLLPNRFLIEKI